MSAVIKKRLVLPIFLVLALVIGLSLALVSIVGANGTVLLQDNYNVDDTVDINDDLATRQAGSSLGTVNYTKHFFGPSAGTQKIESNKLVLTGFFVGTALLNHDFTDADITSSGGYSTCLTISPTAVRPGTPESGRFFTLATGQSASIGGTGFPGTVKSEIAYRLASKLGTGFMFGEGSTFVFDADPALGKIYNVVLTVETSSFSEDSTFIANLYIDGVQMDLNGELAAGLSSTGTWDDDDENFISLSAINSTWTVDNIEILAGVADANCTAADTTPPVITAALVPIGDGDDEGVFRVEFSVTDTSDPAPSVIAVLEVPGLADIPVTNGQVIEFEVDDEGSEVESEDGILEIEAPSLTLRVTGTDAAGNSAEATDTLTGTTGDDDDDDDDDDD